MCEFQKSRFLISVRRLPSVHLCRTLKVRGEIVAYLTYTFWKNGVAVASIFFLHGFALASAPVSVALRYDSLQPCSRVINYFRKSGPDIRLRE